jgi:hypothetical protein
MKCVIFWNVTPCSLIFYRRSSEKLVFSYQTTHRHISENCVPFTARTVRRFSQSKSSVEWNLHLVSHKHTLCDALYLGTRWRSDWSYECSRGSSRNRGNSAHDFHSLNGHRSAHFIRITFRPWNLWDETLKLMHLVVAFLGMTRTPTFLRKPVLPFSGYLSTELHDAISQKTVIVISNPVKIWNPAALTSKLGTRSIYALHTRMPPSVTAVGF